MADGAAAQGSARGLAIGAIAVVAVGVGLALAAEVLVPIAIALLLYALLRPLVRRLQRWKIPPALSAVVIVIGMLALLFGIGAAFSAPLKEWAQRAPKTLEMARSKMSGITSKLPFGGGGGAPPGGAAREEGSQRGAGSARAGSKPGASSQPAQQSQQGSADGSGAPAAANRGGADGAANAQSPGGDTASHPSTAGGGRNEAGEAAGGSSTSPGAGSMGGGSTGESGEGSSRSGGGKGGSSSPLSPVLGKVFGTTASLITGMIEVLLLLAFLLAAGDRLREKVKFAIRGEGNRERAVEIAEEIEAVVSRYVVATALINVGQGVAVGLAMWALGLPTPALWGLLTVVVEFVPYLGALVMVVLLSVAGLATFGNLGHALLAPAAYMAISTLQNNLVSPVAYGRRLKLSPAVILVAVMVWWFLWGVAGAFVAVPVVAALKVLTEHVPSLRRFTDLLSD